MTKDEAIKILQNAIKKLNTKDGYLGQAIDMAIKSLEQEPIDYKTQHENYLKKSEVIISQLRVERDRLRDVFDKVKVEIETKYGYCDICEYFEDYDYEENDISEYRPIGDIADILQIIDKYKAEMENKE